MGKNTMAKVGKSLLSVPLLLLFIFACASREAGPPEKKAPVLTPAPARATPSQDTRQLSGELEQGRLLYINQGCINCHGGLGEGGIGATLKGAKLNLKEFQDILRMPSGMMPAFDPTKVTDEQIKVLYNYIKSLDNIQP